MFNLDTFKTFSRAVAFGAVAVSAIAFAGSAKAAPVQIFPFFQPLPPMAAPQPFQPYQPYQAPTYQTEPSEDQDAVEMPARFRRQTVAYATREAPGTIIIDTPNTYLYYVLGNGQALRYGIGVGRDGFRWGGMHRITAKKEWPDWTPPSQMLARRPDLPRHMKGGIDNPLGARAMYLGSTLYRIHGSNEPETIGQAVSSGCFRMTNDDVSDLYSRVAVGTPVVVLNN